jgi:hypothetical protein
LIRWLGTKICDHLLNEGNILGKYPATDEMFLPGKLLGKTKIELVTTFPRVLEIPDQREI